MGAVNAHEKIRLIEGLSSTVLELMNIILASIHMQGEGDVSLVLTFLLMPST